MENAVKPTASAIWEVILNVPVGKLLAWIIVIASIVGAIVGLTIKLYKVFSKVHELKSADEKKSQMLEELYGKMQEIHEQLCSVQDNLNVQREVNLKQVRYQIVHTCDDAISAGSISAGKLKSLEELYEEYTNIFHGNGYVKTIMIKVRKLPVTGNLDE